MTMTTKILIWMVAGLVLGSLINTFASDVTFIQEYLVNGLFHVVGAMFITGLKMLVVPLVTFSLICGVYGIGDISKLGRVGIKAFGMFVLTTALAITLGITIASIVGPGEGFLDGLGDALYVVPDARRAEDIHAVGAQLPGDVAGIGVHNFAQQNFGPNGDNFSSGHRLPGVR